MTNKLEGWARQSVRRFLYHAIRKNLESYRRFSGRPNFIKTKDFSEHHAACKMAITHLDLLLKMAKWADMGEEGSGSRDEMLKLMREAQDELTSYKRERCEISK